jgi:D-threo-aldose 1-dehydrogenase
VVGRVSSVERKDARDGGPLTLSPICFGGASVGNLYTAVSETQARDAIEAAWAGGIRYFDTAPHYGLGLSERRLGEALREHDRDEYVLSTKVGRLLVPAADGDTAMDDEGFAVPATHRRHWDFSRDGILRSVEASLGRLGLDRIDVLFLHDPDDHWRQAIEEGYPALAELRDQGVVRSIGAGMKQCQMLADFVRETDMDLVMLAGRYTMLDQSALDEILPLCLQRDVGVVNVGVFNSGLLSKPEPTAGMRYDYGAAPPDLIDRALKMAAVCRRYGVTLPTCAIQFGSAHPAIVSTAMGSGSAERVKQNLDMFSAEIPAGVWDDLVSEGLLRPDIPLPR